MTDIPDIADADQPERLSLQLPDEAATAALARALASALQPGIAIHLSGDLGAGKTAFTRALLRALGHTGRARSPTFTLLEPYNLSNFDLYHFDFYRLSSERAWLDAGFDEYLDGRGVVVIEWPEMAGDTLPAPDLRLRIDFDPDAGDDARRVELLARGARGRACLNAIRDAGFCAPGPGPEPAPR
ncbi:MAG: tRNA (adenosine(37)-N6)-threonylcarbamoyltransferase complex ATPase subunit type 1 TsaE [Limnobacter sp.]|nr:tRNA (adenosine(37)-N6)-threonylcarbamoyltransferase complex ATPase subunit type 1 TsaE [Limnobacter sp.]